MSLQQFKDDLAKECYGQTAEEAQATGLCISCKRPALERCYSEAGRREYQISGMCELCFDALFEKE